MSYKYPSANIPKSIANIDLSEITNLTKNENENEDLLEKKTDKKKSQNKDIGGGGESIHISDCIKNNTEDETSDAENITIQIMNPSPNHSMSLSNSIDIENLFNSNYERSDDISKDIRLATASTNTDTSDYLFNHTRVEIKQKLNATIVRDINDTIRWRFWWRKSGNYFEFLSLVTSLISTVMAFSAGSFDNAYLAFVAGCLGSVSLAFMKATSYAMKESKERNEQLNIILNKAHIKYMPSLIQNDS